MISEKKDAYRQLMSKTREMRNSESLQIALTNIKYGLATMRGEGTFVESRIKAPLSALKKLDKEYQEWDDIKDILGFMVVVDTNEEIDELMQLLASNSTIDKNPKSKTILKDYRHIDFASEKAGKSPVYHPPRDFDGVDRDYYIDDGYKNVKANVMFEGIPTEIQIKTKAQYIAHEATHDTTYKAKDLSEAEKRNLSDKLFPYFEACAYLELYKDKLSEEEIAQVNKDISDIYARNRNSYERYPETYRNACREYAISLFSVQHQKEFERDDLLGDTPANKIVRNIELQRIFNTEYRKLQKQHPNYSENQILNSTVNSFSRMSYDSYQTRLRFLNPETKLDTCTISGVFDLIRQSDINILNALSANFNKVQVAVYDDELCECVLGHPPMFSTEERVKTMKSFIQVGNAFKIGSYDYKPHEDILPISSVPEDKKFNVGYLPGVFDMLHPGHRNYIEQASSMCEKIVVGLKTDDYVRDVKHKEPVLEQEERLSVMGSLRTISGVVITDNDITPPDEILNSPELSVIFLGSDWINHPDKKPERSRAELENLKTNYPQVELFSIAREKGGPSSSGYREAGLQSVQENTSVYEITT